MIDTKPTTNGHGPATLEAPVEANVKLSDWARSRKMYSRLIGALFLVGFLTYGVGSGLVTSLVGASNFLSTIAASQTILVIGAFLMFLNTGVDVAKGVLFFPILEKHSKRTALAYLATMIVEVVLLSIGVLALLLIVPLDKHAGVNSGPDERHGLPDGRDDARSRGCIPVLAVVPDPADPRVAGDFGLDRLSGSRCGDDRRNLRDPHRALSHDPRFLL